MLVLRALASKTLVQRQQLYCMILYVYPSTSLLLTSTHTNRQPANDSTRWQKNIALVMMGLESGSVGTLAVSVFEDDGMSGSHSQCFSEPNSHVRILLVMNFLLHHVGWRTGVFHVQGIQDGAGCIPILRADLHRHCNAGTFG